MKDPWREEGTELNTNHSEGLFRKRGTVSNLERVPTPHNSEEVFGRKEGAELNTKKNEGLLERRRHRAQH